MKIVKIKWLIRYIKAMIHLLSFCKAKIFIDTVHIFWHRCGMMNQVDSIGGLSEGDQQAPGLFEKSPHDR